MKLTCFRSGTTWMMSPVNSAPRPSAPSVKCRTVHVVHRVRRQPSRGAAATRPPAAQGDEQDQHHPRHGRPTEAAPPEEGEAAEAVPADRAGGEGDRPQQAHPEVEADDPVEPPP